MSHIILLPLIIVTKVSENNTNEYREYKFK